MAPLLMGSESGRRKSNRVWFLKMAACEAEKAMEIVGRGHSLAILNKEQGTQVTSTSIF